MRGISVTVSQSKSVNWAFFVIINTVSISNVRTRPSLAIAELPTGSTPITGVTGIPTTYGGYTHYPGLATGDIFPFTVTSDGRVYTTTNDVNGATAVYSGASFTSVLEATDFVFTERHRTHRNNSYSCIDCFPSGNCPPVGKQNTILAVGTDLYTILQDQGAGVTGGNWSNAKIGKSINGGVSWTFNDGTWPGTWDIDDGVFNSGGFIQFEAGYQNIPAAYQNAGVPYVYIIDSDDVASAELYLARVPATSIQNMATWEYYTGIGWSSTKADKGPILVNTDYGVSLFKWGMSMTYIPVLERFILCCSVTSTNTIGFFESEHPWGPWSLVQTTVIDTGEKIAPQILPLNIGSPVGNTVPVIFKLGGYTGSGGVWDDLHIASVNLTF